MPRYFFETDDEDFHYLDNEGTHLAGPEEARKEVLSALPEMATEHIHSRDMRTFRAMVRDEAGTIVFEGKLTLEGTWRPRAGT